MSCVGVTQSPRLFHHRLEHGLEIAAGCVDHAQHVGGRRLLRQQFAQLVRAQVDFLLQVGVGFLQPAGHVVELIGEALDFVAGLDGDALAQVARADARRSGAQRLDRHHHAPHQEHAGGEGKRQRTEKDETGPLDRRIERRVGLVDRRFDENVPAERRNRRRGGEHLVALDVLGFADLLARRRRRRRRGRRAPAPASTYRYCAAPG